STKRSRSCAAIARSAAIVGSRSWTCRGPPESSARLRRAAEEQLVAVPEVRLQEELLTQDPLGSGIAGFHRRVGLVPAEEPIRRDEDVGATHLAGQFGAAAVRDAGLELDETGPRLVARQEVVEEAVVVRHPPHVGVAD